ncbi:hypothetical protein KX729_28980 [Rhizobium sp. XQZ8]|uniref:hypothetical protein n=1 Tax=Rhizobium populisoli TaxID=2859785 RepID=UPI001CA5E6DA|nr:hypothetical protein [Rhizobium populisoli]MBW6425454.1 hypothetical protein [Rhizobium populisoli]
MSSVLFFVVLMTRRKGGSGNFLAAGIPMPFIDSVDELFWYHSGVGENADDARDLSNFPPFLSRMRHGSGPQLVSGLCQNKITPMKLKPRDRTFGLGTNSSRSAFGGQNH